MFFILLAASVIFFAVSIYLFLNMLDSENKIIKELDRIVDIFELNAYGLDGRTLFIIILFALAVISVRFIYVQFYQGFFILAVFLYLTYEFSKSAAGFRIKKIEKQYIDFLNLYSNFFNTFNNCPDALKETAKYLKNPLKSIISKKVLAYERSLKNFDEILTALEEEIDSLEFKKFFHFTKMYNRYGGNYNEMLNKLKEQALKNRQLKEEQDVNKKTAYLVLGIVILISFAAYLGLSPHDVYTLTHTPAGIAVLVYNFFSYVFAVAILKNI
ncbi:MAG TPA: hypothetical protein GX516_11075 [Thermoanaerobacter sp.]|nr:hypothetical protein [Thermoanaerobacter sp.]